MGSPTVPQTRIWTSPPGSDVSETWYLAGDEGTPPELCPPCVCRASLDGLLSPTRTEPLPKIALRAADSASRSSPASENEENSVSPSFCCTTCANSCANNSRPEFIVDENC